jgi:hypothetical protein
MTAHRLRLEYLAAEGDTYAFQELKRLKDRLGEVRAPLENPRLTKYLEGARRNREDIASN